MDFNRTAVSSSLTGVSPRPMLMGAPRNAVWAFNAGVSLCLLRCRRPQSRYACFAARCRSLGFPQKKSVMAHPPSGSAQKERIRFALYCADVILRAFFVKVHSAFPGSNGERGKPLPARSRYSQSNFILTMAVMSLISKWRFMYSSTQLCGWPQSS